MRFGKTCGGSGKETIQFNWLFGYFYKVFFFLIFFWNVLLCSVTNTQTFRGNAPSAFSVWKIRL